MRPPFFLPLSRRPWYLTHATRITLHYNTHNPTYPRHTHTYHCNKHPTPPSTPPHNIPFTHTNPPPPPPWHPTGCTTKTAQIPYQGLFRITSWNARGLLAYDLILQARKYQELLRLAAQSDIICLQETHSTEGNEAAWTPIEGFESFWSHKDRHQAGIVILIRQDQLGREVN